jgi:2-amino-4-hydroxy-6-hydroxymethyldihydropteridine diphosphokinase
MILVALGSNMKGAWGTPEETVRTALTALDAQGIKVKVASRLMLTKPYGKTNQPDFVNAVAVVETHAPPMALLQKLHRIETAAGRRRKQRWGPRTLDLDIIDYHGLVRPGPLLSLPHSGIAKRLFVLKPIAEIAPRWIHPELKQTARMLLKKLDPRSAGGEI